jgi:hypothetical protein
MTHFGPFSLQLSTRFHPPPPVFIYSHLVSSLPTRFQPPAHTFEPLFTFSSPIALSQPHLNISEHFSIVYSVFNFFSLFFRAL